MRRSRSNVPQAALKWSVERAGVEFGLTSNTLRKALAKNSAAADADGLFTTAQILAALYGALHFERLRTQRARARQLELENAITTGSVLDRASLAKAFASIADAVKSRIMASELSRVAKEDVLRDIASWPLAMRGVADRQTRLLPNNNTGQDHEPTDSETDDNIAYERSVPAAKNRRRSAAREKRG
jgi:hypothetical protein